MPPQLGLDAAWVHCRGAHATAPVTPIKLDGEEDVGRFGTSVRHERVVRGLPEMRIVEIHIRGAVRRGTEAHQAPPGRSNAARRFTNTK